MDYTEKKRRLLGGIVTPQAIHVRLVAARKSTGQTAKDLAASAGMAYTTFKSQEGTGSPSLKLLDFWWREHGIDPNFIMGGDAARLPTETIDRLLEELVDPETSSDETKHE